VDILQTLVYVNSGSLHNIGALVLNKEHITLINDLSLLPECLDTSDTAEGWPMS
jgi:hypothetical protein